MKKFGKVLLRVAVWALGHQAVIKHVVDDAKAKNVQGIIGDVIAADPPK